MIFKTLDFHLSTRYGEEPVALHRRFRTRINHIVDSFSMRIPKKVRTLLFHKLNVHVCYERAQKVRFYAIEGYASVEIVDPNGVSMYKDSVAETVNRVKGYLRKGIRIAAKYDSEFAANLELWESLLATVDDEFDFDFRVSRSHRSRRWRCVAVMRVTPTAYHYDILIQESKTRQIIERHRIKTTECVFPFFVGIGFSRLRWENSEVIGLTKKDVEVFRIKTGLPPY